MAVSRKIYYFTFVALSFAIFSITNNINIVAVINIISLFAGVFLIKRIQGVVFSPFVIILLCMYLFHSGHLYINLFSGYNDQFSYLFSYGANIDSITGYISSTKLLMIFTSVGLLYLREAPENKRFDKCREPNSLILSMFIVLFFISLYLEFTRGMAVQQSGYSEFLYKSSLAYNISVYIVVLSTVFLFLFRNNSRVLWTIVIMILVRSFLILLLTGNRGAVIVSLLVDLFICKKYTVIASYFDTKKILLACAAMLLLLPFISLTRDSLGNRSLSDFVNTVNPIYYFFAEFGSTIKTFFLSMDYVNAHGDVMGQQLLQSSLATIPGITRIHDFGNPSIALNLNSINDIRGLGGSVLAQLYYNFGDSLLLYLSTCLLSLFICSISNKLMSSTKSSLLMIILLCIFSGLLTSVRGEIYDTIISFKYCMYSIIILKILQPSIFSSTFKKRLHVK